MKDVVMCSNVPPKGGEKKAANGTLAVLSDQLAELVAKMEGLAEALEATFGAAAEPKTLPEGRFYALPTPYYETAANDAEAALRRRLREAEEWLESADGWVERTRAEEHIESLRRELGYSAFDRPRAEATVVAVEQEKLAERQFAEPAPAFTDRAEVQERIDRFERRTRS